jgi:CelD/BcsL family acetyltransferase involved in cellulose biosynthesis
VTPATDTVHPGYSTMDAGAAAGLRAALAPDDAALREAWSLLAGKSANVFATWEWADVWWRHFGAGARRHVVTCRDADDVVRLIVALTVTRIGGVRVLRFIGHGPADELGPVCAADDRHLAGPALQLALLTIPERWDVFLGERLPAGSHWSAALTRARAVQHESTPVISLGDDGWDGWLATRSPNARQQMRRYERRLARRHEVVIRRCTDQSTLARDLEALFTLHKARWGEHGSDAFGPARRAFHAEWAAIALDRGWLRLWTLELGGRPAAVLYGLRFGDVDAYYQSGRDPAHEADSVGFVLLTHAIRDAASAGQREYRLLRGDEAYKGRFADHDPGLVTLLVPRTGRGRLAGRLAAAGAARDHRLRRAISTRLRRT